MKTAALALALLISLRLLTSSAMGSSAPWIGAGGSSITVPAGKILIIEQMSLAAGTLGTNYTEQFQIGVSAVDGIGSATTVTVPIALGGATITKLPAPIRLGPGMTISESSVTGTINCFGTVEDATDFIASANPSTIISTVSGGSLAAIIDSGTSGHTTTSGQTSSDLTNWSSANVSVAKSATNPRVSKVITSAQGSQQFIRAQVIKHALAYSED